MRKKTLLLIVMLSFVSVAMAIRPNQTLIDSLTNKWIPDKRVAHSAIAVKREKLHYIIMGETTELNLIKAIYKTFNMPKKGIIDRIKLLPDTTSNKKYLGITRPSVTNIRKHPRHSAELLSQAVMGTPVRILKDSNEHFLIQTPEKYIGWAPHSAIETKTENELNAWKQSSRLLFVGFKGILYADTTKTEIISDITQGALVIEKSKNNAWTEVLLPNNKTAFIENDQLIEFKSWAENVKAERAKLIEFSQKFMGTSYLWGGTSTYMLDCSGFCKSVYFMFGYILPRDASQQCFVGEAVDIQHNYNKLQPGDLLFFGDRSIFKPRITHVGMYMGNGKFIHESEWVRINSLNPQDADYSEYYTNRLITARNLLTEKQEVARIINSKFYF
jgi:cell wall-associated NlpC family hydrolase